MQSSADVSSEVFEKRSHAYGILYGITMFTLPGSHASPRSSPPSTGTMIVSVLSRLFFLSPSHAIILVAWRGCERPIL